ncbi:bifunctional 2-C-methyl-D-erythritol 4-phosphate cytidylyltransferase/2-C-methyl-D-erythritol 2,4-cyclodiphosphate synthase [Sneathiella sp.]|uniref:bifunctional 2-C-methyl-D-erythritol 4-phosphate cytidylyltransferase/2-C-methyl-D-erythritol 2,4-cyclodiphosphate synthase n=1 Tax=Sneathiella sp. TaxID=1964365 RepID=UPI0035669E31
MKVIALIVAAGRGQRTGLDLPKQYIEIAGKTVLRRSVEAFARHPGIDEVCVVINAEDEERYQKALGELAVRPWVAGGAERQASVANGLESLTETPPNFVLIHDAARPFVTQALITDCLEALHRAEAVLPAVRSTDTLKICEGNVITGGIDRDTVVAAQTPQCFAFAPILAAHRAFAGSGATDDIALAEMAGLTVAMVAGDVENFKITTAADIDKARRRIVGALTDVRSGQGVDVHAFEAGRELWLAGIKIPHNKGLKGHSDADVALHALTDALLGALGAGDIGTHFPPSDSRWKGVASEIFLKHSASLIAAANGVISNIDLTIICEAPKISPYRQAMIARIAEILGISEARVSVKGTTTEKLGFTGRGEGIAAQAIATIRLPE